MELEFRPYQAVTLVDDQAFLGYIVGRMVDRDNHPTGQWMIGISQPGQTGLQGDRPFNGEQLRVLDGARPNSTPARQRKERSNRRRCAPRQDSHPPMVSVGEIISQPDLAEVGGHQPERQP